MNIVNEPRYSITDAARISGMSKSWWQMKINNKEIRYLKVGNKNFIPESTINGVVRVIEPKEKAA